MHFVLRYTLTILLFLYIYLQKKAFLPESIMHNYKRTWDDILRLGKWGSQNMANMTHLQCFGLWKGTDFSLALKLTPTGMAYDFQKTKKQTTRNSLRLQKQHWRLWSCLIDFKEIVYMVTFRINKHLCTGRKQSNCWLLFPKNNQSSATTFLTLLTDLTLKNIF